MAVNTPTPEELAANLEPPLIVPNNPEVPGKTGARDRTDLSYTLLGKL